MVPPHLCVCKMQLLVHKDEDEWVRLYEGGRLYKGVPAHLECIMVLAR